MIEIDSDQLKADLQTYLEKAMVGETIVVFQNNVAIAEIRPPSTPIKVKGPRPMGLAEGMGEIHPSFYEPLPPDTFTDLTGEKP
jgi:antitoxin (DNA-binding transcriptional repressor) of toxin-antitoxin stability system